MERKDDVWNSNGQERVMNKKTVRRRWLMQECSGIARSIVGLIQLRRNY